MFFDKRINKMLNQPLGRLVLFSLIIAFTYLILARLLNFFVDQEEMHFIRKILKYVLGVVFAVTGYLIYRTHKKNK